jgi:hypothetical protein
MVESDKLEIVNFREILSNDYYDLTEYHIDIEDAEKLKNWIETEYTNFLQNSETNIDSFLNKFKEVTEGHLRKGALKLPNELDNLSMNELAVQVLSYVFFRLYYRLNVTDIGPNDNMNPVEKKLIKTKHKQYCFIYFLLALSRTDKNRLWCAFTFHLSRSLIESDESWDRSVDMIKKSLSIDFVKGGPLVKSYKNAVNSLKPMWLALQRWPYLYRFSSNPYWERILKNH